MSKIIDPDSGLPVDMSKVASKDLLLKPLDVDDLMNKFYETPWEYNVPYLFDSRLEETFNILRDHLSIEFGDWRYRFVPYQPTSGPREVESDNLHLEIWAERVDFDGHLRIITDRYLHPFQYPLPSGEQDHAEHFESMLLEANRRIINWNQIVARSKPIIYQQPNLEEYKEDLLDDFYDNAIFEEWNYGAGLEFNDFDEFVETILFTHWHLDLGFNKVLHEFDPFYLVSETIGFRHSTVLQFVLEMSGVDIELVLECKEFGERSTFPIPSMDGFIERWLRNSEDLIIQWNDILTGRRNDYGRDDERQSQDRLTG